MRGVAFTISIVAVVACSSSSGGSDCCVFNANDAGVGGDCLCGADFTAPATGDDDVSFQFKSSTCTAIKTTTSFDGGETTTFTTTGDHVTSGAQCGGAPGSPASSVQCCIFTSEVTTAAPTPSSSCTCAASFTQTNGDVTTTFDSATCTTTVTLNASGAAPSTATTQGTHATSAAQCFNL